MSKGLGHCPIYWLNREDPFISFVSFCLFDGNIIYLNLLYYLGLLPESQRSKRQIDNKYGKDLYCRVLFLNRSPVGDTEIIYKLSTTVAYMCVLTDCLSDCLSDGLIVCLSAYGCLSA